ncbi:MAG: DUF2085 domain-containing protein [Ignavibacteriaceae bacterium]|nr:DUF2085 domain-containing protein [Ignavibacteriaceae bacterium]
MTLYFIFVIILPFLSPLSPKIEAINSFNEFSLDKMCHQNPEKSFFISDIKFPVCSRCTGIYSGFILISLIFLVNSLVIKQHSMQFLIAASIFMLIDVLINNFIVYSYLKSSAFITGLVFSLCLFSYIYALVFGFYKVNDSQ